MNVKKEISKKWPEVTLCDMLDYIQPTKYIVESTEYDDSFKIPVLTAGKSFIKGYTNESHGIFNSLPVIIFDDFTTATKFVNFPFKVKSSAMKILSAKSSYTNIKFVYYYMQTLKVNTDTHKRYWISVYSKIKIPYPSPIQQQAIVSKIEELLSDLENGKQQLQTALQQLKIYRQSLLKSAFVGKLTNPNVKPGELPKGWVVNTFNEIGSWKGGGTPSKSRKDFWEDGNILWVSPKDMKSQKIVDTIDKITADAIENSSTKIIPKGSILFVVRSGILRRTLPVALTICEVTVNQDIQAFTPNNVLPEYIYWYVCALNNEIRQKCSKDGTTVESIESSLLKSFPVPVCSYEEQQLIVNELESKLTVCDKLEETIIQSLLQSETLKQSILKKAFEGKLIKQ